MRTAHHYLDFPGRRLGVVRPYTADLERQVAYRQDNPGKPGQIAGVGDWPDYRFPCQVEPDICPLRMRGR